MKERLDAWREQGANRIDPLRFALMQALARRAEAMPQGARARVEVRLQGMMAAYALKVAETQAANDGPAGESALAELLQRLSGRPAVDGEACPISASYPELPLLDEFRDIWTRVSADLQLRQSKEQLPENAGPLNSDHLVHRALSQIRKLSPEYLHQFMAYVETLSWLERLNVPAAPAESKPRAKAKPRKPRAKKVVADTGSDAEKE